MRYPVLTAFNGRTMRFKPGQSVGAAEIADTAFSVSDLLAQEKIGEIAGDVEKVATPPAPPPSAAPEAAPRSRGR